MTSIQLHELDNQIIDGLDYILSHFDTQFPRTISTKTTDNKQIPISNRLEAIARFKQSNYLDCRINAYPYFNHTSHISFLFIDLDLSNFKSKDELNNALTLTLNNIKLRLNGFPTVLWTGNGYHIYQPLENIWLSEYAEFNDFVNVNTKFLRYAALILSNYKSDKCNYQSQISTMLRIPFSLNSKCLDNGKDVQVKIVRRWNGVRASLNLLLGDFHLYLSSEQIKGEILKIYNNYNYKFTNRNTATYQWIEVLLQTPIADFRKNAITLILAPYLITIKHLPPQEACDNIAKWLDECSKLEPLRFNVKSRVKDAIVNAQKGMRPLAFRNLEGRNKGLYALLALKLKSLNCSDTGIDSAYR